MRDRLHLFRQALQEALAAVYADRLITVAIFGSWARRTATPVSDIDVLVVADPLPCGRGARMAEFAPVHAATEAARRTIWGPGYPVPELNPVLKTPEEVAAGSPLFLDMTEWCDILVDRKGFFDQYLRQLRERMRAAGTRRRAAGGGYYWEYRPGMRAGEVCEL